MLVVGTGAYSAISGNRGFDFGVGEDRRAIVGIETFSQTGENGDRVDLLTLKNNFNEDFSVDGISITNKPPASVEIDAETLDYPSTLNVGDGPQPVSGKLDCSGAAQADVDVHIELSSPEAAFSATRTATIECEVPVEFDPKDCQDIVGAPCDQETFGSTTIDEEKADGSVCVDGEGGSITVDTDNNLYMDGFLLVENASDLTFETGNQFSIDAAVNLYEIAGDITIELGNQPSFAGDFCASADGNITADLGPGNVPSTEFARDVKFVAGGDATIEIGENIEIDGALIVEAGGEAYINFENNADADEVYVEADDDATVDISQSEIEEEDVVIDADNEDIITDPGGGQGDGGN